MRKKQKTNQIVRQLRNEQLFFQLVNIRVQFLSNLAESQEKREAHSSSNLVFSVREACLRRHFLGFHPGNIQKFTGVRTNLYYIYSLFGKHHQP